MRITCFVVAILAACVCSLWPSAVAAQFPKRVKTKGQVAAVAPGKIMMTDETSKVLTLNIRADQNVIKVQGKLAISDLKPGCMVRLEGPLKGLELDGELATVIMFSAADGYEAGIVQDSKDQPAVVTGLVKLLKDDMLTVQAGKKRVRARLAKDCAVTLDSKDYSLAPTGSLIEADGYETKNGSVNAKKVVITVKSDSEEDKRQDAPGEARSKKAAATKKK